MAYKYLEHEADIGIYASGGSYEEAFSEGAKAMFNAMVNIKNIRVERRVAVSLSSKELSSLFVEWLNKLLTLASIEGLLFSRFEVEKINESNDNYKLRARACGESLDVKRHELKTEVKAATYFGLKVGRKNNTFFVQCILDI